MSLWQRQFAAQYKRYVQSLLQPGPDGTTEFDREFLALRSIDEELLRKPDEFRTALLPSNRPKNRPECLAHRVLPNEDTKVELYPLNDQGDGKYINASYIDGQTLFDLPFNYIATQAPMENTVGDFWRMIAECGVLYIVMLTSERGRHGESKSAVYWPTERERLFRPPETPYTVRLLGVQQRDDVIVRRMQLLHTETGFTRTVTHFQYVGWPEGGLPDNTVSLMSIIMTLGKCDDSTLHPIVVHCGGGVGRTGVFIAMHVCLALFNLEKNGRVKSVVGLLKYQRTGMVSTKQQYQFLVCGLNREYQRMVVNHAAQTQMHQLQTQQQLQQQLVPHQQAPPQQWAGGSQQWAQPPTQQPQQQWAPPLQQGSCGGGPPPGFFAGLPPSPTGACPGLCGSPAGSPQRWDAPSGPPAASTEANWPGGGGGVNPISRHEVPAITDAPSGPQRWGQWQPPSGVTGPAESPRPRPGAGAAAPAAAPPHRPGGAEYAPPPPAVYPAYPEHLPQPPAGAGNAPGWPPSNGGGPPAAATPPPDGYTPPVPAVPPPRPSAEPFAARIHDAVYGAAPVPRRAVPPPQPPATAGGLQWAARDASPLGAQRAHSPPPAGCGGYAAAPQRPPQQLAPSPRRSSGTASSGGGRSQREAVLEVLARLTEQNQRFRSTAPASQASHADAASRPVPAASPSPYSAPAAPAHGGRASPTHSGGFPSLPHGFGIVPPPAADAPAAASAGAGARLRGGGADGVRKYAEDFERTALAPA